MGLVARGAVPGCCKILSLPYSVWTIFGPTELLVQRVLVMLLNGVRDGGGGGG
jgi:hypothetical protein